VSINREAIHTALYAQLQTVSGAVTVTRKLRHPNEVEPEEMPYIAMVCKSQHVTQQQHRPKVYTLPVDLYVYVSTKGSDDVTQVLLNQTLDAIDRALEAPHNHPAQTLGVPQVIHVRVEGEIQTDEGTLGEIAVAVVPVEIIAAG